METKKIAESLRICGEKRAGCVGCAMREGTPTPPMCYERLKLLAAAEIETLAAENKYLRDRLKQKNGGS